MLVPLIWCFPTDGGEGKELICGGDTEYIGSTDTLLIVPKNTPPRLKNTPPGLCFSCKTILILSFAASTTVRWYSFGL